MVYLLVTLSWGDRVHGRTRMQNYVDDLYDRSTKTEEKEIVQIVEEKRRTDVHEEEDTPTLNDYRLQDLHERRRNSCFKGLRFKNGCLKIECNKGCRLTCKR